MKTVGKTQDETPLPPNSGQTTLPAATPLKKNILSTVALLFVCVLATFVADMLLTGSIWKNPWFPLIVGLLICWLVNSFLPETKLKKIANLIIYICLLITFVMMFVYDNQTNKPINKASTPQSTAPAISGKMLNIELKSDEIYNVDDLKAGQNWRYLSFNGTFSHRVDKGDGQACWKVVDNNLLWSADYTGKLQIKAGNMPVKLTVNVL